MKFNDWNSKLERQISPKFKSGKLLINGSCFQTLRRNSKHNSNSPSLTKFEQLVTPNSDTKAENQGKNNLAHGITPRT